MTYEADSSMIFGMEESKAGVILDIAEDYFGGIEGANAKALKIGQEQALQKLMRSEALDTDEKEKLVESIRKPLGRNVFASIIGHLHKPSFIESESSFNCLGEVLTTLLAILATEKDFNITILRAVATFGSVVFTKVSSKPVYLYTLLSNSQIWQNMDKWKKLVDNAIERKIKEVKEATERQKAYIKEQEKSSEKGLFSKFKNAVTTGVASFFSKGKNEVSEENDERTVAITAANVLTQLAGYMINYKVNVGKAQELILHYGTKYKVSLDRLFEIHLELQVFAPLDYPKRRSKDNILQKHEKVVQRFSGSYAAIIIGLSLAFISDFGTLKYILVLNRKLYNVLKTDVFKHVLLRLQPTISLSSRVRLWWQILQPTSDPSPYLNTKKMLETTNKLPESIDELIALDIHRSFVNLKSISHESLISILRCFATSQHEVAYCQGMNFIVGFLLLLLNDEAKVYNCFQCLINKYQMIHLFTQDVPLLRKYFYELDRLLHEHYPELIKVFKSEGINSSYFTSSWFITLFTNSLQYSKDGESLPALLLAVWDAFLIDGWKAIFKAAIFIIGELEEKLIEGKFDSIMMTLGELPRNSFMKDEGNARKFKEAYGKIRVTGGLLDKLSKEYKDTHDKLSAALFVQEGIKRLSKSEGNT